MLAEVDRHCKRFVGDFGQNLVFHISGFDFAALQVGVVILKSPNGVVKEIIANVAEDHANDTVTYTLADGDLDCPGIWEVQLRVQRTIPPDLMRVHFDPVRIEVGERFDQ
jgi:hypothetical protein